MDYRKICRGFTFEECLREFERQHLDEYHPKKYDFAVPRHGDWCCEGSSVKLKCPECNKWSQSDKWYYSCSSSGSSEHPKARCNHWSHTTCYDGSDMGYKFCPWCGGKVMGKDEK
jgi:hypothetical protein